MFKVYFEGKLINPSPDFGTVELAWRWIEERCQGTKIPERHYTVEPIRVEPSQDQAKGSLVDHPVHYNLHASGIECIEVIEHMSLNVGTAVKYVWRHGFKPDQSAEDDLNKAIWYLRRELFRLGLKEETSDPRKKVRR